MLAPEPQTRRRRFRIGFSAIPFALLLILLVLLVLYLIPANSYLLMPGQALNVEPMISVKGHPLGHKHGQLYMTDVSLYKANHLLEELYGRVSPNTDVEPAPQVSGNLSPSQFNQLSASQMTSSIQDAVAAALNATARYKPHYVTTGPKIVFLVPHLPASNGLKVGEVVEYVDGHRTLRASQVGARVRQGRPGRIVRFGVLRLGHLTTVPVRTVPSTNGAPSKHGRTPLVGIVAQDQIVFPIKVSIRAGDIGGPSAGLMFSLGIIQRLATSDIAKGCKVAGTGTIDSAGNVGAIGGAKQKIVAARNAGARYFLVPNVPENVGPARANRGNVTVVPVSTLSQALRFLRNLKPCR